MSLAEEMVDGEICSRCQMPFEKAHGYPVVCRFCAQGESAKDLRAEGLQIATERVVSHGGSSKPRRKKGGGN